MTWEIIVNFLNELLSPVYTIQPVVKQVAKPVWQPVVSCIQTFNRLSNPFDNRFDKTAVSCIQPVVNPVVQPGLTTGWTNSSVRSTRLSNRFDNRFDNRLYRVNGVLELWDGEILEDFEKKHYSFYLTSITTTFSMNVDKWVTSVGLYACVVGHWQWSDSWQSTSTAGDVTLR